MVGWVDGCGLGAGCWVRVILLSAGLAWPEQGCSVPPACCAHPRMPTCCTHPRTCPPAAPPTNSPAGDSALWIHAHQGDIPRGVAANIWRSMGH